MVRYQCNLMIIIIIIIIIFFFFFCKMEVHNSYILIHVYDSRIHVNNSRTYFTQNTEAYYYAYL